MVQRLEKKAALSSPVSLYAMGVAIKKDRVITVINNLKAILFSFARLSANDKPRASIIDLSPYNKFLYRIL